MHRKFSSLLAIAVSLAVLPVSTPANAQSQSQPYFRANELQLDVVGAGDIDDLDFQDTRLGYGLGLNYFITENLGFGGTALIENPDHRFIDEADIGVIIRAPFAERFALYAKTGVDYRTEDELWQAQMAPGYEMRFTHHIGLAVEFPIKTDFHTTMSASARAILRFTF